MTDKQVHRYSKRVVNYCLLLLTYVIAVVTHCWITETPIPSEQVVTICTAIVTELGFLFGKRVIERRPKKNNKKESENE